MAFVTPKGLRFKLESGGQNVGERDMVYRAYQYGTYIGDVLADWVPSATPDWPVAGFFFTHRDGRVGEGTTRAKTIADALHQQVTQ